MRAVIARRDHDPSSENKHKTQNMLHISCAVRIDPEKRPHTFGHAPKSNLQLSIGINVRIIRITGTRNIATSGRTFKSAVMEYNAAHNFSAIQTDGFRGSATSPDVSHNHVTLRYKSWQSPEHAKEITLGMKQQYQGVQSRQLFATQHYEDHGIDELILMKTAQFVGVQH